MVKVANTMTSFRSSLTSASATDAIEFVIAARADKTLGILLGQMDHHSASAELRAALKPYARRSTGLKMLELASKAPNPTRLRRWLETSTPHLSLAFSPVRERWPPVP
jgi:hypothetical protein